MIKLKKTYTEEELFHLLKKKCKCEPLGRRAHDGAWRTPDDEPMWFRAPDGYEFPVDSPIGSGYDIETVKHIISWASSAVVSFRKKTEGS